MPHFSLCAREIHRSLKTRASNLHRGRLAHAAGGDRQRARTKHEQGRQDRAGARPATVITAGARVRRAQVLGRGLDAHAVSLGKRARGKGECRLVARDKQERMAIAGEFFGKRPGRCLALRREGTQFLALSRQSANDLVLGIGGTGRTSSHLIHKGFSWKPTLKGALAGKALLGQWKTPCEVPSEVAAKMT
jgi:hypothetical protein